MLFKYIPNYFPTHLPTTIPDVYPIYDISDFELQKGMVPLNFLLLKLSGYNIGSYSIWLEKLVG